MASLFIRIGFFMTLAALLASMAACRRESPADAAGSDAVGASPVRVLSAPVPASVPGQFLEVDEVSFAGPAGHRAQADFARGETVICLFTVSRFTYRDGKAHIRARVEVLGPSDETVILLPDMELLKGDAPTAIPGSLRTAATLPLHPALAAGRYHVRLTLRDELSGREGLGRGHFTLLGTPPTPAPTLTLSSLQFVADKAVPAGAVMPITVELKGAKAQEAGRSEWRVQLGVVATLKDAGGTVKLRKEETLLDTRLPFAPIALPVEYQLPLPRGLTPGPYSVELSVKDLLARAAVSGTLSLRVVPTSLQVVNLHLHDGGGLSRPSFLQGEQVFVRLEVFGLKTLGEQVSAAVDLAVAGPDNGLYLVRKDAASLLGASSSAVARAGRFPVQLPLVLPVLAPTGRYRVVIRARDRVSRTETTRELPLHISGLAPPPLGSFKVDSLEVRQRPDLPELAGDTFAAGRSYHLVLRVGGMSLKERSKAVFEADLEGGLRLRDLSGRTVFEKNGMFTLKKTFTYRPLRLLLPAVWEVPRDLPSGLYDLDLSALNRLDDRASQLTRRVEIVGGQALVPLP